MNELIENMDAEEKNELVEMVDGEATTTSLIIAEGTGVEHASIIKLIRNNLNDFNEFGPVRFEIRKGKPLPQGGFAKATEYAILNERHSTLLFSYMRNSEIVKQFKIRLVKKFYEMRDTIRNGVNAKNLSRMDILKLAMESEQERLRLENENRLLENKVAEQAPKAEGFDRIARADGLLNLTNAAKSLNVRPKDLFDFLQAKKWIYRRVGGRSYSAYQDKIQCGYLTHKVYAMTLDDGTERIREQVVVTPRGLTKLASIVPREAVLV